jgi:hypothetical protein
VFCTSLRAYPALPPSSCTSRALCEPSLYLLFRHLHPCPQAHISFFFYRTAARQQGETAVNHPRARVCFIFLSKCFTYHVFVSLPICLIHMSLDQVTLLFKLQTSTCTLLSHLFERYSKPTKTCFVPSLILVIVRMSVFMEYVKVVARLSFLSLLASSV